MPPSFLNLNLIDSSAVKQSRTFADFFNKKSSKLTGNNYCIVVFIICTSFIGKIGAASGKN